MSRGRVIVFGGSGYLGSHVADSLSEAGFDVAIFDHRPSPYLQGDQKMIVGDLLDETAVEKAIAGSSYVYNFAGIANIDECVRRPLDTVRYNILGNSIVTDAAAREEVKRYVFASSAYVYSDHGHFYRTSKQACESLIEDYSVAQGLSYTILRFGSIYGGRSDERNSIHRILKQALHEGRIDYDGTGEEVREYIHALDAAKASVDILQQDFLNQCVMLTGVRSFRYRDLLEMIKEMLNNRVEIVYHESRSDAHYRSTPYTFNPKLSKKLVMNPHVDLGQGLLDTLGRLHAEMIDEQGET